MPKVRVTGIKVIIRDLRGHLLHTVTFLVSFYFSKKIRLEVPCESDSHKISCLIFSEKNEKEFMNAVCCSRDWRFKG